MTLYLRKFNTYTPSIQKTAEFLAVDKYMKVEHQGADGPVPVALPDVYNNKRHSTGWDGK